MIYDKFFIFHETRRVEIQTMREIIPHFTMTSVINYYPRSTKCYMNSSIHYLNYLNERYVIQYACVV